MLEIKNETQFKNLFIDCNGERKNIKQNESAFLFIENKNVRLNIFVEEKNCVFINYLFAIIDGFISDDHISVLLNCNAEYEFIAYDNTRLILSDLETEQQQGYKFQTVYLKSNDTLIEKSRFTLTEFKKEKRKTTLYFTFLTSLLPLLIILFILFFISEDFGFLIPIALLFPFTISSWKKAFKIKKIFTDENANNLLQNQEHIQRQNYDNPVKNQPTDFIGKSVNKIFNLIFKNRS